MDRSRCPRTDTGEWKALADRLGEHEAYLAYFRHDDATGALPTVDEAIKKTPTLGGKATVQQSLTVDGKPVSGQPIASASDFRQRWMDTGKFTPEHADAMTALAEANRKYLGKSEGEYYPKLWGDITSGGEAVDKWEYTDLLHPDNKTSRKVFEEITGQKLPKTLAGTKALFDEPRPGVNPAEATPANNAVNPTHFEKTPAGMQGAMGQLEPDLQLRSEKVYQNEPAPKQEGQTGSGLFDDGEVKGEPSTPPRPIVDEAASETKQNAQRLAQQAWDQKFGQNAGNPLGSESGKVSIGAMPGVGDVQATQEDIHNVVNGVRDAKAAADSVVGSTEGGGVMARAMKSS